MLFPLVFLCVLYLIHSGSIPSELGNVTTLTILKLNDNNLEGEAGGDSGVVCFFSNVTA